jgi:hypothetical protein
MDLPVPPQMTAATPQRKQTVRIVVLVVFVCFCAFVLFPLLIAAAMGFSMFSLVKKMGEIRYRSYTDKFQVTVLEVKFGPDYFVERVRVRCERDMEASIWVTDLKEAGIFETSGMGGEVFYREGHPHKAGSSVPVHADGKFSTCDILFKVSTTSSNTIWHDEVGDGTLDTTLPTPLPVSGVQTNWPGSYQRGSSIPLANLGDYKVLLSIK